jgi:hypothetical protein
MRKVLLATTALVAMSVTGAQAADISIGGNLETNYVNTGAGDSMKLDGNVVLSATQTTDAGVTYEVVWSQRIEPRTVDVADGGAAKLAVDLNTIQQASLAISSADLGTVYLGNADDDAIGMMDGATGSNQDIEGNDWYQGGDFEKAPWMTPLDNGGTGATWISPNISGFQVGASTFPGKDNSSFAAKFSAGGIEVMYGNKNDDSLMAVKGSVAGFTVATAVRKVDGSKSKANDFAVKYSLPNGITVAGLVAKGTDSSGNEKKYNNVGASYSLAPGITLKVEAGEANNAGFTFIGVNSSF